MSVTKLQKTLIRVKMEFIRHILVLSLKLEKFVCNGFSVGEVYMKVFVFRVFLFMFLITSCTGAATEPLPVETGATKIQLPVQWTSTPNPTQVAETQISAQWTLTTNQTQAAETQISVPRLPFEIPPSTPTRLPFITMTPPIKPARTSPPEISPTPSPEQPTPDPACVQTLTSALLNGQKILFESDREGNREIYIMNLDGSGLTNLTQHPADDWEHRWSPGGDKISFLSDRDGDDYLYVMNRDGSHPIRITNIITKHGYEWSPTGRKIAFVHESDDQSDIYVVNSDGSGLMNLTQDPAEDWDFAWSPNGQKIAFVSSRDGDGEIYVINVNGSGLLQLTHNDAGDDEPIWSPDGYHILFSSRVSPYEEDQGAEAYSGVDLYTVQSDGSNLRLLTTDPALSLSYSPVWSHDGSKVLFSSILDSRVWPSYIFIINVDGTGLTQLSNVESVGRMHLVWSPDARRIAINYGNSDAWSGAGSTNIVMVADGTDPIELVSNSKFNSTPSWTRDSAYLVFRSGSDEMDLEDDFLPAGYGINIIRADGTCFTRLTVTTAHDRNPILSPP